MLLQGEATEAKQIQKTPGKELSAMALINQRKLYFVYIFLMNKTRQLIKIF